MNDRTIIEISIDDLYDSPFNAPNRATLAIDELAANIKAEGRVHSALLVRPRVFIEGVRRGDTERDQGDEQRGYEIVFGHRRRYAAESAGLATVPCEVRAMTDDDARSAQASENVQRENLKALEEAEQYQAMIDSNDVTANDLAARIGKSRSHVYGRLRLLDLCPQVRAALTAGEVKGEVALLIARVGDEKMQAKALHAIRAHNAEIEDGGAKSFRRIRELLNEKFTLDLAKAIFPIEAEMLVPSAGNCTTCRKRTGNAPEFADVAASDRGHVRHGGAMVCTDPDCFEAKKKAHLKAEAARLQSEGAIVIAGGKARQAINAHGELGEGYVAAAKLDLAKAKTEVEPITIQNPRDGTTVQAYRAEDLQAAGVKVEPKAIKVKSKAKQAPGYDPQAYARERQQQEEKARHEERARRAILAAVRARAAEAPRSEFDLRLVARAALDRLHHADLSLVVDLHGHRTVKAMRAAIETMDADACGRLLIDCALVVNVSVGGAWALNEKPEALLAAAGYYGIDTDAVRQAVQTPAPEADVAAPKAKPKKGAKKLAAGQLELDAV